MNHNGLAVPAAVPRADLSPVVQDDGPPQQSPGVPPAAGRAAPCPLPPALPSTAEPGFAPTSAGAIPCPATEIPTTATTAAARPHFPPTMPLMLPAASARNNSRTVGTAPPSPRGKSHPME
ncbi:hypothetical protein GCM10009565_40860 [Amycolatopsis albidoflavus]